MSKFMLRYEVNKDCSILHVINFLVTCGIMSFEEARPMSRAFHIRGEDVMVDIPDVVASRFMAAMDAVCLRYESL